VCLDCSQKHSVFFCSSTYSWSDEWHSWKVSRIGALDQIIGSTASMSQINGALEVDLNTLNQVRFKKTVAQLLKP
jgi:hypothetical protein